MNNGRRTWMQETGRNKTMIRQSLVKNINVRKWNINVKGNLKADSICVHHLFQAWRGGFFTLRFVRFRNCFNDPDDMYSVMNITWYMFLYLVDYSKSRSTISSFILEVCRHDCRSSICGTWQCWDVLVLWGCQKPGKSFLPGPWSFSSQKNELHSTPLQLLPQCPWLGKQRQFLGHHAAGPKLGKNTMQLTT